MADGLTMGFSTGGAMSGISSLQGGVRSAGQMGMYDAIKMMFDLSQSACPVLSGELKDSGAMEVGDESGSVTYTADHAVPVALGHHTRNGGWVDPNDFITPAFDAASKAFPGLIQNRFGK